MHSVAMILDVIKRDSEKLSDDNRRARHPYVSALDVGAFGPDAETILTLGLPPLIWICESSGLSSDHLA